MSCACKLLPIHRLEVKARRAVRNSSNYITLTFREVLHMPIAEILAFPGENLALLHKNFSPKKSKNRLLAPHGSSAQTSGIPKLIVINIVIPRFARGDQKRTGEYVTTMIAIMTRTGHRDRHRDRY